MKKVSAIVPQQPKMGEAKAPRGAPEPKAAVGSVASADLYWVQVGAYRDAETAKRLAQRLREQRYQVQESVTRSAASGERGPAPPSASASGERDRYEVVVTGPSSNEVQAQLTAKGLTSRAASEGAVITPALSLGEAVTLSRDLSDSGLAVRVRRTIPPSASPSPPPAPTSGAGETLYRVRVGGFAERAAAVAALKELEGRGYKPFLARGNE